MVGTSFAQRLELALQPFESVHAFSKKAGISDTMMRKYLAGSVPGLENLLQIADAAGVTLDWLAAERGPMRLGDPASLRDGDLTLVERLDVEASAGNGTLIESEQALDFVAFQTRWLRRKGINPAAVRLLNIRGDSMEPTIRDGDIALVDTSINDIIDNAIYVLVVGNRLLIKRIHVLVTGALRLISDNPIYPHEDVKPSEAELVRVSGRVVWFGRSI